MTENEIELKLYNVLQKRIENEKELNKLIYKFCFYFLPNVKNDIYCKVFFKNGLNIILLISDVFKREINEIIESIMNNIKREYKKGNQL